MLEGLTLGSKSSKITTMSKILQTAKLWNMTIRNAKMIAAYLDISMVQLFDDLVRQKGDELGLKMVSEGNNE